MNGTLENVNKLRITDSIIGTHSFNDRRAQLFHSAAEVGHAEAHAPRRPELQPGDSLNFRSGPCRLGEDALLRMQTE